MWFTDVTDDDLDDLHTLLDKLEKDEVELPKELLINVLEESLQPVPPLCRYKDLYYFQKYWLFETSFFQTLPSLLSQTPELKVQPVVR